MAPAESATGKTGSTQGETAVAAPAMKPKRISNAMPKLSQMDGPGIAGDAANYRLTSTGWSG